MSSEVDPPAALPEGSEPSGFRPRMSLARWIGGGLLLGVLALCLFMLMKERGIPADVADGSYVHDCCGTIELRNGRLSLGTDRSVDYIVERDELGPYILPEIYVGPWEESGFEIDGSRPPLKLRLDSIPRPNSIELYSVTKTFAFKRKRLKARRPASQGGGE